LKRQSLIYKKSHPREKKNTAKAKNIKKKKKKIGKQTIFVKAIAFFLLVSKAKVFNKKLTT